MHSVVVAFGNEGSAVVVGRLVGGERLYDGFDVRVMSV